jgi:hypothetical protein
MNYWKPLALVSIAAVAFLVGKEGMRMQEASAGGPCHDQPNMAAAVNQLHGARASLERAEHNKGGWRIASIEATDKAIHEADRGCAFDDAHH